MRMKKVFVVAAAALLLAGIVQAASIEIDLDGIVGNGPDHKQVEMSDMVSADVWILGPPADAVVVGAILCNDDLSLVYQSCVYNLPGGAWFGVAPTAGPQITVQAQTFAPPPVMTLPWKLCTLVYHAAIDKTVDTIYSDATGGLLNSSLGTVLFDNNEQTLCTVHIGTIDATEETNWGAVKSLFR